MLKRIQHWAFYISISIISLYSLLFLVLYFNYTKLPDSGFSREIEIHRLKQSTAFNLDLETRLQVLKEDESWILAQAQKDSIRFDSFDALGKKRDSKVLTIKNIDQFRLFDAGLQMNAMIYKSNDQTVRSYLLKANHSDIDKETSIQLKDASKVQLIENGAIYYSQGKLLLSKQGLSDQVICPIEYLETIQVKEIKASQYAILYTNYQDNGYYLHFLIYDSKTSTTSNQFDFSISSGSINVPTETDFSWSDKSLDLAVVIKDTKAGANQLNWFHKKNSDKDFQSKQSIEYGYKLSPTFFTDRQQLHLSYSKGTSVGKVEIGSSNNFFENVVGSNYDQFPKFVEYTRSMKTSYNPTFFSFKNNNYMVFSRLYGNELSLNIVSDSPDLIHLSKQLPSSDWINLMLTTATTFLPLSYIALILEVYILTPVLGVVILISMVKITWAERNGRKLLFISLGLHVIAKYYFIWTHLIQDDKVIHNFPSFMNTPLEIYGLATLFTSVSLLCLHDFTQRHKQLHYLNQYIFFNLIDLIQFIMLFTPYYLI